ncbi:MAG: SDR family oxidoreductase [Chlorobi bacterium]|nr:SDR family oxidoreductase [Chlorobiota bacterium]
MKRILVTGATDGIGKQTAFNLAEMGYEVILHGRNEKRGRQVMEEIARQTGNKNLHYFNADFTDFREIEKMAVEIRASFKELDVLLNNAGVYEDHRIVLPNGFEKTFMVNHLAPFSLTLQLLDLIGKAEEGRIVNVASVAQAGTIDFDNLNGEKYYDGYNAYALSKLENVLFTYKLARELEDTHITANCLHPGVIGTKLLHAGWGVGGAPVEEGARNEVYVATSPELKGVSGRYFVNRRESRSAAVAYDTKVQDRLWEISLKLTGLSFGDWTIGIG